MLFTLLLFSSFSCKKEIIEPNKSLVKDVMSVFDGDVVTITKNEILEIFDSVENKHVIQVSYRFNNEWIYIPISDGVGGANITVLNNGNISIVLNLAPIDPSVLVRIVVK